MIRSGFKAKGFERKPQPLYAPMTCRSSYAAPAPAAAIVKADPSRSEPYRRLVAAMACKHCGIVGYSQAAHSNSGKSKGVKTDDRTCFALCCARVGVIGCHYAFDNYSLMSKAAQRLVEAAWAADTRRAIVAAGDWPSNLPLWTEE